VRGTLFALPVKTLMLEKTGLAVSVVLILTGAAWISGDASTGQSLAYSLLALIAYGLQLADGASMGFVFIILALPGLGWLNTLFTACAAILILAVISKERPTPRALLQKLGANAVAIVSTQAIFHARSYARIEAPVRLMIAAGACFIVLHVLERRKPDLWTFAYYPVTAGIASVFPVSVVLPPLGYVSWRSYRLYERRLERQRERSREVASLHLRTIETIALAIEARDQPITGQQRRVQIYSVEMAKALGLPPIEIEALRAASILYDVGEMAVPENIIMKAGPLTPDEFEKVKIHPEIGAELLERVKFPYPVAPIVRAHHEKWDGTGYPAGMKGEEIPIGARILSVVDAFDALLSARHHRSARSVEEALASITAESGRAYDPRLVSILKKDYKRWERLVATKSDGGFIDSIASAQRELHVILELTHKLGASLEVGEIFSALDSSIRTLIPFDTLAVRLERDGELAAEYVAGDHVPLWSPLRIPMGAGVSGWVAANQKPTVNGDAALDLDKAGGAGLPNAPRFALAVPLEANGERGALTLYRAGELAFCTEDARVLGVIAPKLASALTNGLKFRATADQAATDALTGLPNASALFTRLQSGRPVAVLVCDLDGFKQINDRFGHVTGNRVLEALAEGFRKSCRGEDFVARLGGDEFVLLLGELRPEDMGARVRQFREMVLAVGRQVCGEAVLDASFGAAFYPADGATADELLAFADRQMYRHKARPKTGNRQDVAAAGWSVSAL